MTLTSGERDAGGRKIVVMLSIISVLIGAVLAQRFKVFIFIPAMGIMFLGGIGAGVAQAYSVWWSLLTIVAAGASLQLGYVIGLGMLHVLEAPREEVVAPRSGTSVRNPAA